MRRQTPNAQAVAWEQNKREDLQPCSPQKPAPLFKPRTRVQTSTNCYFRVVLVQCAAAHAGQEWKQKQSGAPCSVCELPGPDTLPVASLIAMEAENVVY